MTSAILAGAVVAARLVAADPGAQERWLREFKNPTAWLNWGTDLRIRNEYLNGAITLSDTAPRHEQDYLRYRSRVWATATGTDVSVTARLSGEPRSWLRDSFSGTFGPTTGLEPRYGLFDNLFVKWTNVLDAPLTLSVGRQDVQFGEPLSWWLVGDGTPGDGSWTFYLDSARATWEQKDSGIRLDIVGISQAARPDRWLPALGRTSYRGYDYVVTDQDEKGAIVYVSTRPARTVTLDGYWIYKEDDRAGVRKAGLAVLSGDNAHLSTFGARVVGSPSEHWQYSLEAATQTGGRQGTVMDGPGGSARFARRNVAAYGGTGKMTWFRRDPASHQLSLVAEFLSGDDAGTPEKDEMFDVLWGRWPGWSEMYIYSYINETGGRVAQMNNLGRTGVNWKFFATKQDSLSFTYNALLAPRAIPSRRTSAASSAFSGTGHFRGHYTQVVLRHSFSKVISGHLWAECLWKGSYYQQRRPMTFLRAEMLFSL